MQLQSGRMSVRSLARASLSTPTPRLRAANLPSSVFGKTLPSQSFSTAVVAQKETRKEVVVAAKDAAFDQGITGKDDYSPLIAVIGFAAVWFNKLQVDRVKLLQGLAILQLFTTIVNLVTRRGVGDKISNVVSPSVLAVAVLSIQHVTYLDAATALFGYFISETLEGISGIPFYVFVLTLAVALYLGYGTLWYVAAFGIASAGRLFNSTRSNDPLPVLVIPSLLASIFAIWKEAHFPLALTIYLAQTLWSGLGVVDALTKRAQD